VRLDRVSRRRVATFAVLVLASALCGALVAAPVDPGWTYETRWLVWNLGLAWLPFVFALVLYDGYRRGWGGLFLGSFGVLWLLFLPNAPYILTDFVHLRDPGAEVLWYDALTIGAFALAGLVLGLGSLYLVHAVVAAAYGHVAGWVTGVGALALSSVGIYLGRFLGLNSWDAVIDPWRVLSPLVERLDASLLHPRFLAVTTVLTAFLVLSYLLLYPVARAGLQLEPARMRRR
jgi:uncharacterized membrane protein